MRIGQHANRPRALMLSHCVPADGSAGARQADAPRRDRVTERRLCLQLLRWISDSHDVSLACVQDGPVHLDHWRTAATLTDRLVIAPVSPMQRLLDRAGGWFGRRADLRSTWRAIGGQAAQWAELTPFDAVIVTPQACAAGLTDVDARVRLLDARTGFDMDRSAGDLTVAINALIVTDREQAVRRSGTDAIVVPSDAANADSPAPEALVRLLTPADTPADLPPVRRAA